MICKWPLACIALRMFHHTDMTDSDTCNNANTWTGEYMWLFFIIATLFHNAKWHLSVKNTKRSSDSVVFILPANIPSLLNRSVDGRQAGAHALFLPSHAFYAAMPLWFMQNAVCIVLKYAQTIYSWREYVGSLLQNLVLLFSILVKLLIILQTLSSEQSKTLPVLSLRSTVLRDFTVFLMFYQRFGISAVRYYVIYPHANLFGNAV